MERGTGRHVCMLAGVPACTALPPTRRSLCSVAMCKLLEFRQPSARHHGAAACLRSQARLRAECDRLGAAVHPYSLAALVWDYFHAAITLVALLYVPCKVFVTCPNPYDPFILFADTISFLHIIFSFTVGFVTAENKQIVLAPKAIVKNYLKTFFIADLVGALPLQTIEIFDDCRYPSNTTWLLLKLFKLPTLAAHVRSVTRQMRLGYVANTLLCVLLKVLLFFHWMTFIHYQVPCFVIQFFAEEERSKVWLKRFMSISMENDTIFQKYTTNLFLVCGLCIGVGKYTQMQEHLISELVLTSSVALIGMAFLTHALSELLQLCIYTQYEKNLFEGRNRELKQYMNMKKLPDTLQRKVQLYLDYKYNGHYYDEAVIMSTINEQIRQDITMCGCKDMLRNVPLFRNMPVALVNAIVFRLSKGLYMPGEKLVVAGELGTTMFMISCGTVAVVSAAGRELAHLRDGSYFGETSLLAPNPRPNTVFALEITEAYILEHKDFHTCLQPYPRLRRRLEALSRSQ